jgi:hypothetical protein
VRIYLDTCSIQRPLDTLSQTRVRLEAEAILGVLERVEAGEVDLISSTVLELEVSRNSLAMRREHGEQVLARSNSVVIIDEAIGGEHRNSFNKRSRRWMHFTWPPQKAVALTISVPAMIVFYAERKV